MKEFEVIHSNVIKKLEEGLPKWLSYHNVHHTEYVIEQANNIAKKENISGRDLFLINVAALYHDVGYLVTREEHESLGCEIATLDLQSSVLDHTEIQKVCGMIMATHIPQKPTNILEKIIADADLEYFGTDSFEKYSNKLYMEIRHYTPELSKKGWDEIQVSFLSKHFYHTQYCQTVKEPIKQKNLDRIKDRLLAYPK